MEDCSADRIKPCSGLTTSFIEREAIAIKKQALKRYGLYVARWGVLAVPGAAFLVWVSKYITNTYLAMVVSQMALGAIIFFVDRLIFRDRKAEKVVMCAETLVYYFNQKGTKFRRGEAVRDLKKALDELKEG